VAGSQIRLVRWFAMLLALGFLLLIGTTLVAEGFGAHVPKGYIYSAMAFSVMVEMLNMRSRRIQQRRRAAAAAMQDQPAGH
jgi:predicted tellurium resistance membrane protein TerC